MQAERWRQIDDIFQAALDCALEERPAFLDSACGGDEELRHEVESLLALEASSDLPSSALEEGIAALGNRSARAHAGRAIGPYRVLRRIGQGGMGSVYLAARADEAFEKLVAIKVVRAGLEGRGFVERFRKERRILAALDHPNIARLLDGGSTADGLPYFVMEFIEGQPIDEYCDQRKLSVTERVKCFLGVCAAVSYAHQNLIVHRDIKPGNVLVTKDGVPRLLDFGIAKLLDAESDTGDQTVTRVLTPEYASPEQVRGEAVTTASDVYSLGVLLYRLVTGQRPYGRTSTAAELERAIVDVEPESPSVAVMRGDDAGNLPDPVSRAAVREGTPEKLRHRLQDDIDNIVLMALRKEPQRRYASAEQLSADIRRHLANLPVLARPDTRRYRAAKFLKRNRTWVAMAAVTVLSLGAGAAATLWQNHVARQQRDRARLEQARAERIKTFLQETLTFASPSFSSLNPAKNKDAKISEAMDYAVTRAETQLANQPEVLAEIQATIGTIYESQGRFEQAEAILRTAQNKYIRLYGPESHEIVAVSGALANILIRTGKYDEAERLFRKNIEIERAETRRGHANGAALAYSLGGYGAMLDGISKPEAEGYLKEALQHSSVLTGRERAYVAMLHNNLGNVAYRRGDLDEAERRARAALDEYRKLPAGTYIEMGTTLSNLGAILIRKNQLAAAEPFVREGLDLRRKVLGDAHPDTAMALFRLSDLLYRQGDFKGALDSANESVAVFKRALAKPEDNPFFANPLMELGLILDKMGRLKEAEANLRLAVSVRRRLVPKGNQLIGITEGALGECLALQKKYAEAEPLLLNSFDVLKTSTTERDPRRLEAAARLASLYTQWGKPSEASHFGSLLR